MDNLAMEKVRFRDILAGFKSIFIGNSSIQNEKIQNEKLEKVYEIEEKSGAAKSIKALEKDLATYIVDNKKSSIEKIATKGSKSTEKIKEVEKEEMDRERE